MNKNIPIVSPISFIGYFKLLISQINKTPLKVLLTPLPRSTLTLSANSLILLSKWILHLTTDSSVTSSDQATIVSNLHN